jgi:hypothetical protein
MDSAGEEIRHLVRMKYGHSEERSGEESASTQNADPSLRWRFAQDDLLRTTTEIPIGDCWNL